MTKKQQTFVDGLIVKSGKFNQNAHLKIGFNLEDFGKFVKEHKDAGWLNIEIRTSLSGNVYAVLDDWKPEKQPEVEKITKEEEDDLPF